MSERLAPGSIGIIVLAAGTSRRFAGDKRRALLEDGRGLLESTLAAVPSSFSRRLLVLRPDDAVLAADCAEKGWEICLAAGAHLGMGHSLAAGIRQASSWRGALVALADMPFVRPRTYALLQEALAEHEIVVPVYGARRGHPVGFRQPFFAELARLEGDRGARGLLACHGEDCHPVTVDDPGVLRDIDTREAIGKAGASPRDHGQGGSGE